MKILLCIGFVLACFISGFAQEKSIDKSEFDTIVQNSTYPNGRWRGKKSFRSTITTESRAKGMTQSAEPTQWTRNFSTKAISEYAIDVGTSRSVSESTFQNDEPKKAESVKIGDIYYVRIGNGNWTKKAVAPAPKTPPPPEAMPNPYENVATETTYKYLGTESYKNASVRTYLKTEKQQSVNKGTGNTSDQVTTTKYWIAEDGTILKSDFRSNRKDGEKSFSTNVVMEYELDPSISITAPVVP